MQQPLVSITSAFFNTGPAILDMVHSILAQDYQNWELLLLDDGSTDDTKLLLGNQSDDRIKLFSNGQNKGRGFSLNRLNLLSNGKYIARMDSDDFSHPKRISRQVELLEVHPEIDAAGTGIVYLDKANEPVGIWQAPVLHKDICGEPHRTFKICHGSIMARKHWFNNHKYNEKIPYAVDFDLLHNAQFTSQFVNIREPLYYYRLEDSFNLKKQFIARWVLSSILWRSSSEAKKYAFGFENIAKQQIRFIVTVLMLMIGMKKQLLSRRYRPLSKNEKRKYSSEISTFLTKSQV